MRLDFVELGSFVAMLCASIILYFLAYKFLSDSKRYAYLSAILGTTLMVHGLNHLAESLEYGAVGDAAELLSAILAVAFGVAYSYLK